MRRTWWITVCCLLFVQESAAEPTTRLEATAKSEIAFRQQTYQLAWVHENRDGDHHEIINEYILPHETLDQWTRMICVRNYPGRRDFKEIAAALVANIKQISPTAKYAIHGSEDGKRVMVDFLLWSVQPSLAEFNIFILELDPSGTTVVSQQLAARAYGDDVTQFLTDLREERPRLIDEVTRFNFPKVTTQPVDKRRDPNH